MKEPKTRRRLTLTTEQRQIGAAIRERRESKGWTVSDLAARAGLSQAFLSHVELGSDGISLHRLTSVAEALGVTVTTLMRGPVGLRRKITTRPGGRRTA